MPQGAGFGGDKRAGGNPNGGKASGGQGSFGDRGTGYGGLGYKGPGAGQGFKSGSKAIQGSRNTLHNIATRPGTLSNIATALGLGLGFGPGTAAGLIGGQMLGYDPYSGPTGTGTMIEHDPINAGGMYNQQGSGLAARGYGFLRPNAGQPKPLPGLMAQTPPQPTTPAPTAQPFSLQDLIAQANGQGVPRFGPGRPLSPYLVGQIPRTA